MLNEGKGLESELGSFCRFWCQGRESWMVGPRGSSGVQIVVADKVPSGQWRRSQAQDRGLGKWCRVKRPKVN